MQITQPASATVALPLAPNPAERSPAPTRAEMHQRIAPFARASSLLGYGAFVIDSTLYALGIASVLMFDSIWAKIAGGLLAGFSLVKLGSLSHEAAHRALVKSRLGNKLLAVITLTVVLFNYRLWVYDHHVRHHGRTNVRYNNFLSPLTLAEYQARSPLGRAIYRAYHSETTLGILLYYMLNRWPDIHFYPGAYLPERFRASAWGYCALVAAYAGALVALLVTVASAGEASVAAAVLCGFVLPYTVWFAVFSMTAFLQHTNPRLRWYNDVGSVASKPEALSVHVHIPAWINHSTHYVLEHPVHHVSAAVPHYYLKKAQAALADVIAPPIIEMKFTLANTRDALRRCKLYDYDRHVWTDFSGQVTGIPDDTVRARNAAAGTLLPDLQDTSPGIFFQQDATATTVAPAEPVDS